LTNCANYVKFKDRIDNKTFRKDKNKNKNFDREVDYKLISENSKVYKVEVKLMGRGNPESADAVIARDTDIFVADTLSEQNKNQLKNLNIKFLEMKNNKNCVKHFNDILKQLKIIR
jgi:hypothetical protein